MNSKTTFKHEDADGSIITMEIPGDKVVYELMEEFERFLIAVGYVGESVKKGWEYMSKSEE